MEEDVKIRFKKIEWLILMSVFMIIGISGGMSNIAAVSFNDGKMPVKMSYYYEDDMYFSYQEDSEVNKSILTDRFRISYLIFSIGDVFIVLGTLGVISCSVRLIYFDIIRLKFLTSNS